MCMTMFTATATQVLAVGDATELITVTSGEFKDNKITYTISVAPNTQKITGVILEAHFDGEALKATASGSGFSGMYETGLKYNQNGVYAIAYMDMNGYTVGNTAKEFATITFEAISDVRDMETVEFKCVEFVTDDGNADNDIVKANVAQRFYTDTFHTLTMPKVTEVNSVTGGQSLLVQQATTCIAKPLRQQSGPYLTRTLSLIQLLLQILLLSQVQSISTQQPLLMISVQPIMTKSVQQV